MSSSAAKPTHQSHGRVQIEPVPMTSKWHGAARPRCPGSRARPVVLATIALAVSHFASASHAQSVTRTVSFDYDAYGTLSRQTVEPDDTTLAYKVVTDISVNTTYGVVQSRTLSWQDPVLGAQSRVVETNAYDARYRYATTVTNAKSQSETRAYDDAYGNLTSLTGPNALTTTWQYDGWGRKTRESRADGTATSSSYAKCIDTCASGGASVATSVLITRNWSGANRSPMCSWPRA